MHDLFEPLDRLFRMPAFHENDHVARLPVVRDQQAAPERAFQCIFKAFRSLSEALYGTHSTDGMGSLREFLNSIQVSWRRNIA